MKRHSSEAQQRGSKKMKPDTVLTSRLNLQTQGASLASPWQCPQHPILDRVFEKLLFMEDGRRWIRQAGQVCSYWRSTSQEILLEDTAVSRPARPPMPETTRIIPIPTQHPAQTLSTQAAVVLEASNSTGLEDAISKESPYRTSRKPAKQKPVPPNTGNRQQAKATNNRQNHRATTGHQSARARGYNVVHPHPDEEGSIQSGLALADIEEGSESDGSTGAVEQYPPSSKKPRLPSAAGGGGTRGGPGRKRGSGAKNTTRRNNANKHTGRGVSNVKGGGANGGTTTERTTNGISERVGTAGGRPGLRSGGAPASGTNGGNISTEVAGPSRQQNNATNTQKRTATNMHDDDKQRNRDGPAIVGKQFKSPVPFVEQQQHTSKKKQKSTLADEVVSRGATPTNANINNSNNEGASPLRPIVKGGKLPHGAAPSSKRKWEEDAQDEEVDQKTASGVVIKEEEEEEEVGQQRQQQANTENHPIGSREAQQPTSSSWGNAFFGAPFIHLFNRWRGKSGST